MDIFNWQIDLQSASRKRAVGVNVVKFGDGYEQRQAQGIAPSLRTWQCSKTAKAEEINAIETFLLNHAITPYLWTPCDEAQGKFVLDNGEVNREAVGGGWYRLSWTAREVRA